MEQLIITAILIIIAVISYVAQAIAKWRQMQEEEARRRQRQARMEAMPQQPQQQRGQRIPQPPQQAAPRPQQKPLEDEISEFLREAARRRSGERPAKPGAPKTPPPPARERPVVVEVVEPAAPAPLRSKLESQKFPSLQGGLEQRHLHADQEIQSHVQEVFAHSVGSLDTRAVEPVRAEIDESPILAAGRPHLDGLGLAAMFANPASLRQAILAHEIFRRPEERWR
ncbi:MAG: hypothetical protein KJZ87_05940 [Thermoguttaceae bacterium]|nr:hypothetical protein [Thermoguttaceae bacterium]